MHRPLLTLAVALVAVAAACADDSASAPADLSDTAREGFTIAQTNGCFACHGDGGLGGPTGPALVGLAGTTVALADGTTALADTAYLRRSITDPGAQKTGGFVLVMPANALSDDQVASVVAWIEETSGG